MRRRIALIASLVLVGGLVGCGEDSSGDADNEEFCSAASELQKEVDEFNSMVTSDASPDDLATQATAVGASAKNLSAATQRLDDPAATDTMNQASQDLQAAVNVATSANLSPEQETAALESAVDQYAASVAQVSTQAGCGTG